MDDPHAVLGLDRHADKAEIKRAYRALAKVWHPDGHMGDPAARERFVQINEAYRALVSEDGRGVPRRDAAATQGKANPPREAAKPAPAAEDRPQDGAPEPSDDEMMERIFGVTPPRRRTIDDAPGLDAAGDPETPGFAEPEAARGSTHGRTVLMALNALFGRRGKRNGRPGETVPEEPEAPAPEAPLKATASVPLATIVTGGTVEAVLPDGRRVIADIPRGSDEGTVIVLTAEAHGTPGPVELTVVYAPSDDFRPAGDDLHATLAIDLETAVLGGAVALETLDGPIRLTVPAWSGSDRTLRVAARGLPGALDPRGDERGDERGDLLVHLRVMLPETADPRIVEVMRQRREGVYV